MTSHHPPPPEACSWGAPLTVVPLFVQFSIVQSWALCFGASWRWVEPLWL